MGGPPGVPRAATSPPGNTGNLWQEDTEAALHLRGEAEPNISEMLE